MLSRQSTQVESSIENNAISKLVASLVAATATDEPANLAENVFSGKIKPNSFCWPNQLDLGPLRDHDKKFNPYGDDFDYAKAVT